MSHRDAQAAMSQAANRLRHLSMRYAGAMVELVAQQPVGMLAKDHPGMSEVRDFIDLILFTRAEISALTRLLVHKGVFTVEEYTADVIEQYEWFTNIKAKQLGVGVTDTGITFSVGPKPEGN